MFNKQHAPTGNDDKDPQETKGPAEHKPVTLPVLPPRVIAGLMGTLL